MISVRQKGDFSKTIRYLENARKAIRITDLDRYGREGVAALSSATPVETGLTSQSWSYETEVTNEYVRIAFHNSNVEAGIPVAILIQYGHATRDGGWIEGRDYINPAIQPIFDDLANKVWKEVTK